MEDVAALWPLQVFRVSGKYKEVYLKDVVGANNYNISMLQDHDCLNIYKAPNAD